VWTLQLQFVERADVDARAQLQQRHNGHADGPEREELTVGLENRADAGICGTGDGDLQVRSFGRRVQRADEWAVTTSIVDRMFLNELGRQWEFHCGYTQGAGVDDPLAQLTSDRQFITRRTDLVR